MKLPNHLIKTTPMQQTNGRISFSNKHLTFFQVEISNICGRFFIITRKAFKVISHLPGLLSGLPTPSPKQQTSPSSQSMEEWLLPPQTKQQAFAELPPGLSLCNPTFCMFLVQCPITTKGIKIWCHQSFICKTTMATIKSLSSAIRGKEFAQNKPSWQTAC